MTTPLSTVGRARIDGIYTPKLVSFDPGLDLVGWAEFRRGLRAPTPAAALSRLTAYGKLETETTDTLAQRLTDIYDGVRGLLGTAEAFEVAVEVPSKAGEYNRTGKKNAAAMQHLERAIGVIIVAAVATVGAENVRLIPAPSGRWAKKEYRHAWLRSVAKEASVELPVGPRGGIPHDVWDAIWNGIQVIRTPRMVDS